MFKPIATAMLVSSVSSVSKVPCEYDLLTMNAYIDPYCTDLNQTHSDLVKALQDEHADKQTGMCEYFGDEKGISYISSCDAYGWYRSYYSGSECTEDMLITDDNYEWDACQGPDALGFYMRASTY